MKKRKQLSRGEIAAEKALKYMRPVEKHYFAVGFNRGYDQGYEEAAEAYERNLIKFIKKRSKR
jgi:hypothetical protein